MHTRKLDCRTEKPMETTHKIQLTTQIQRDTTTGRLRTRTHSRLAFAHTQTHAKLSHTDITHTARNTACTLYIMHTQTQVHANIIYRRHQH